MSIILATGPKFLGWFGCGGRAGAAPGSDAESQPEDGGPPVKYVPDGRPWDAPLPIVMDAQPDSYIADGRKIRPLNPSAPETGVYLGVAHQGYFLEGQVAPEGPGPTEAIANLAQQWDTISGVPNAIHQVYFPFPNEAGVFPAWETSYLTEEDCADTACHDWNVSPAAFFDGITSLGATPYLSFFPTRDFHLFYTDWFPGNPAYEATVAMARKMGETSHPFYVDLFRESNGWWMTYGRLGRDESGAPYVIEGRDDNYRAAFHNVASVFREYAPNADIVLTFNQGYLGMQGEDHFRPLTPDPADFDVVSLAYYRADYPFVDGGYRLWGGTAGWMITHDDLDDPATEENESVNWYQHYGVDLGKMLMLETAATFTHRSDLFPDAAERGTKSHDLKAGYWDPWNYGWLANVYASSYAEDAGLYSYHLNELYPQIHAIIAFQVVSWENFPEPQPWSDWRIGFNQPTPWAWAPTPDIYPYDWDHPYSYNLCDSVYLDSFETCGHFYPDEVALYRNLVANPYFLSEVEFE